MAFEIKTSILIHAKPEAVWKTLTKTEDYPEWNPFVTSLQGELGMGNKLSAQLPGMKFTPTIVIWNPGKEFAWLGHLWVKGLFDGQHGFRVEENADGSTTFHHTEQFKGLLVPLFKKMLKTETKPGFEAMNEALKKRVEQS